MRKIILISFYSPPRFGKKNQLLVEHIFTNLNQIRTTHPGAGVIMAGDVNNLKVERLLAPSSPSTRRQQEETSVSMSS